MILLGNDQDLGAWRVPPRLHRGHAARDAIAHDQDVRLAAGDGSLRRRPSPLGRCSLRRTVNCGHLERAEVVETRRRRAGPWLSVTPRLVLPLRARVRLLLLIGVVCHGLLSSRPSPLARDIDRC
jgi:hypothetical protein